MADTSKNIVRGGWKHGVVEEKIMLAKQEMADVKPAALPAKTGEMTVTPQIARGWLARDNRNRPLRVRAVAKYLEEMVDDRWKLNGQSISFKEDGSLNDGQHRLFACVVGGVSFQSIVVIGVPNDAFSTVDTGLPRRGSDVLALAGYKYHSWLSGAIKLAILYGRTSRKRMGDGWEKVTVFNEQIHEFAEQNPAFVKIAADVGGLKLEKMMTPSTAIFAWWEMRNMDKKRADIFMNAVASGENLSRGHPALTLRNELLNREGKRLRPVEVLARIIKAWNAFYYNKSFSGYRFRDETWFPNFGDADDLREASAAPPPPRVGLVKAARSKVVEERLA